MGTLGSHAAGWQRRSQDQQHPLLTVALARAEPGGCQVLLLIWLRFCWGRKPAQKQVLGSRTGLCCTFPPTGLSLQRAKNNYFFFPSKINLSSPFIPPPPKETKDKSFLLQLTVTRRNLLHPTGASLAEHKRGSVRKVFSPGGQTDVTRLWHDWQNLRCELVPESSLGPLVR